MPKIYEYLGITFRFYSEDHEPIHVHAVYGKNAIKVSFFIKDGRIYRVTYKTEKGNFTPNKLKQLKKFISVYKYEIVRKWQQFYIWKMAVDFEKINKKL